MMYIRFLRGWVLLSLFGCVAGCATQPVADPNAINLKQALVDTVDALAAAHEESIINHENFGFYGCTVTAAFNISATAGQENKLALSAAPPAAAVLPVSLGGSASFDSTASGTRGNTVTVVFATKPCLAKAAGSDTSGNTAKSTKTTTKTTTEDSSQDSTTTKKPTKTTKKPTKTTKKPTKKPKVSQDQNSLQNPTVLFEPKKPTKKSTKKPSVSQDQKPLQNPNGPIFGQPKKPANP
jgi:hypothetical protein